MSGAGIDPQEPSNEDSLQESDQKLDKKSDAAEIMDPGGNTGSSIPDPLQTAEELSSRMERAARLGTDLSALLSELSREVTASMEQLHKLRSAIDLKKSELKMLYEIEASATALEQLIEDHRLEQENFKILMDNQRSLWEEKKAQRIQAEKEYLENLRKQRKQEEEEYTQAWTAKRLKIQQEIEEELVTARQNSLEKQKELERDYVIRTQQFQEKEREWDRLLQEMEQLMSRVTARAKSKTSAHADSYKKATLIQVDLSASQFSDQEKPFSLDNEPASNPGFCSENTLTGENTPGKEDPSFAAPSDSFFRRALLEEPKPVLSSLKDILQFQGRKTDDENIEFSAKRDCTTLKFPPKKSSHPKSEP